MSRLHEFTTFVTSPLRMFQDGSERLIDLAAQVSGSSGLIAFIHDSGEKRFDDFNALQKDPHKRFKGIVIALGI